MHYTYTYTELPLECENCSNYWVERTGDLDSTMNEIYKRLRSEGWKLGKKDLCPECSGKDVK